MKKGLVVVAVVFAAVFSTASLGTSLFQAGDVDPDETLTAVEVDDDGDAVFVLEVRTRLEDDTEREAFERYRDDVENDTEAALSSFRDSISMLVEDAEGSTGRSMEVSNFTVEATVEPVPVRRGIVRYRFNWSGFAEADGDEVHAGDVLSGYILRDSDALVLRPPKGYVAGTVDPPADSTDGEVRWDGPRDFDTDQPRVVFVPESDAGDGNVTDGDGATGGDGTPDGTDGGGDGTPVVAYVAALIAVVALGAVVYVAVSRRRGASGGDEAPNTGGAPPPSAPREGEPGSSEPEPEPEPEKPTFEDLSDDERVLSIIESEDGRMKQKTVVERTGWSEAKVSQVTSRLEDEGEIDKLRMGRENIIEISDGEDEEDAGPI